MQLARPQMVMRALGFAVRKRDVLLIVRDVDVNDTGRINKRQFVNISSSDCASYPIFVVLFAIPLMVILVVPITQ